MNKEILIGLLTIMLATAGNIVKADGMGYILP